MKIAQAVDLYLTELEISQKSQAHISKTEWHLQKFVALHGSTEAGEVTRLCLARFVKGLRKENGEPYAPASLHGYVAALKGLFSFLHATGEIAENVSDRLKRPSYRTRSARVASAETVQALRGGVMSYAARRDYNPIDVRDALIVSLSLDSGGRRGEIANVTVHEARQALQAGRNLGGVTVYHLDTNGKTGQSVLRFMDNTAVLLEMWLRERFESATDALFVSQAGQKMHLMSITSAFIKLCDWSHVPTTLSHAIRHRVITEVMRGSDPAVAAQYANHASPTTTLQNYRHLADTEADEAAARLASGFQQGMNRLFGINQ